MTKKHFARGLSLLLFFFALPVGATTISIQVVQMDDANVDVTDSSLLIEEGIMDFMFSQGYIVSNSPIIYNKDKAKNGMKVSLEEAQNGSADYLAYITIYFDRGKSVAPESTLLSNIELAQWKLVKVRGQQQLDGGTEKPGQLVNIDDSERGLSTFSQQLAEVINSAIKKKR